MVVLCRWLLEQVGLYLTIFNVKNTLFQNINILRGLLLVHKLPKSVALAQGPAYGLWCKIPGKIR